MMNVTNQMQRSTMRSVRAIYNPVMSTCKPALRRGMTVVRVQEQTKESAPTNGKLTQAQLDEASASKTMRSVLKSLSRLSQAAI